MNRYELAKKFVDGARRMVGLAKGEYMQPKAGEREDDSQQAGPWVILSYYYDADVRGATRTGFGSMLTRVPEGEPDAVYHELIGRACINCRKKTGANCTRVSITAMSILHHLSFETPSRLPEVSIDE